MSIFQTVLGIINHCSLTCLIIPKIYVIILSPSPPSEITNHRKIPSSRVNILTVVRTRYVHPCALQFTEIKIMFGTLGKSAWFDF